MHEVDMVTIESTAITAAGYDPTTRVLTVEFTSGGTYQYEGVSPFKWRRLRTAERPGSYFARSIRPKHRFRSLAWNRPART